MEVANKDSIQSEENQDCSKESSTSAARDSMILESQDVRVELNNEVDSISMDRS